MIASLHIAEVSPGRLASSLVRRRRPAVPGLVYGSPLITAPLSAELLPAADPRRLAFAGFWSEEQALDAFLAGDGLGATLQAGWHVRLEPTHVFGHWAPLPGMLDGDGQPMSPAEPAAVLTIGRLRLREVRRFLRASARAEELALADGDLAASTGLALPPRLVATFSLWRTTEGMRRYADGTAGPGHRDASRAHAARPFHHEAAFIRFRPLSAHGSAPGWDRAAALIDAPVASS